MLEWLQPPDQMTPLHVHRGADRAHYVLEGEQTFYLPGSSSAAGPGELLYGPRNVPHNERVTSAEPVRYVEVNSPAGFEKFVVAAGDPAVELTLPPSDWPPPDFERLATLAVERDIELLGPPGELP